MPQVGLRIAVVLFPTWLALGSIGACASQSKSEPSSDDDGGPSGVGTQSGADAGADEGATSVGEDAAVDSPGDSSADAGPRDAGQDTTPPPVDSGPPLDCTKVGSQGEPLQLGCTGLYSSWPQRTISAAARNYAPAFPSWSDGAQKARYIMLPPGSTIDTSDMDEWRFPVGTKIWKEFRLNGLQVETRMLTKKPNGDWYRTTYVWSQDQSTAVETTGGVTNIWGTGYDVEAQSDCSTCHGGHLDGVLGFEVVGLSNAGATGLTMTELVNEKLVTNAPSSSYTIPGNTTERAALGTLHANCGNACHNGSNYALAKNTGLFMKLRSDTMDSVESTDTYRTAVNVVSKFQGPGGGFYRIKPDDVAHSAIPYRDGYRDTNGEKIQMPPLGTHKVDTASLQAVKDWINAM